MPDRHKDFIGFSIIVIHSRSRFGRSECRLLKASAGIVFLPHRLIAQTKQIEEIILLCAVKFTFAQMMRILQALVEKYDCFSMFSFGNSKLCKFHASGLILKRNLTFTTFPGVEPMIVKFPFCFGIAAGLIEESYLLKNRGRRVVLSVPDSSARMPGVRHADAVISCRADPAP